MALGDSVYAGRSFVAGAKRRDHHCLRVDAARDLNPTFRGDLAFVPDGAACEVCGSVLTAERGTVLATRRALPPPSFIDEAGAVRLGGAVALTISPLAWFEEILLSAADDAGIAWPAMASP